MCMCVIHIKPFFLLYIHTRGHPAHPVSVLILHPVININISRGGGGGGVTDPHGWRGDGACMRLGIQELNVRSTC